ncbi:MAG: serine hydrolase [Gemmatimonadaceae bacterium]|nr:serine hydrolase [Gemmatimonadaceae bacterium]
MAKPTRSLGSVARVLLSIFALITMFTPRAEAQTSGKPTTARVRAARVDGALQARLTELVKGFRGEVGIYVQHLRTGRTAMVNADMTFPTASIIKVPIMLGTFDAISRGELRFDSVLTFRDSLSYSRDDLTGSLRDSTKIPVAKLVHLMLALSDNTASLWLQGLVGGARINTWLAEHGFDSTRVNSRVAGRESARTQYGWGQSTPREMARMLMLVREGGPFDAAAREAMYRALTRSYWTGEALSQLPPWVQAASKQGMVNKSRSEVVLVNAPSGDYVFAVVTKNQVDESWINDNEGYVLIRAVSALLWRTFEPRSPYVAPRSERSYVPPDGA